MGLSRPHKAGNGVSTRWVSLFCIASFFLGVLVINRFWAIPDPDKLDEEASSVEKHKSRALNPTDDCEKKDAIVRTGDILSQVSQTHDVIMTLDKTISSLEMQLAAARAAKVNDDEGSPVVTNSGSELFKDRPKVFFVMGIITAFSSRKRRDSIRETWMPQGEELRKLEKEKGIIMRFVIGHRNLRTRLNKSSHQRAMSQSSIDFWEKVLVEGLMNFQTIKCSSIYFYSPVN